MLRSVTEAASLTVFTQVGLVLFVVAFVAIVLYALLRSRVSISADANLPIDEPRRADRPHQPGRKV